MNWKINKILLLVVITTFVFVNFFGVVAMAGKYDDNCGRNTAKFSQGKGNRHLECIRLRDCGCNYECDYQYNCDGDRLNLRIHNYNVQELKELAVKLEENLVEVQKNQEKNQAENLMMHIERISNLIKCLEDSKDDTNILYDIN